MDGPVPWHYPVWHAVTVCNSLVFTASIPMQASLPTPAVCMVAEGTIHRGTEKRAKGKKPMRGGESRLESSAFREKGNNKEEKGISRIEETQGECCLPEAKGRTT